MDRLARESAAPDRLLAEAPDLAREIVADLRADYDPQVTAEREFYAPEHHDPDARAPDGVYRYASVWCRRDGAALLVRPGDDDGWCGPGGTWEPGESLEDTARRETREETGLRVELTGVVEVRLAWTGFAERVDGDLRPRADLEGSHSLGVIFHADPAGGDLRPEEGEIDAVGWFSDLPAREDLVFERIADYPL